MDHPPASAATDTERRARGAATSLADEEVVDRVRGGETNLFEILMRRHNQLLYRTVRSILRDETETEDVLQEAYVQAFTHLDQFLGRARFSTWLTRIAVYEALRRRKRRQRFPAVEAAEDSLASPQQGPESRMSDRELRAMLEASVDRLSDQFRTVFVLRDVQGMSTAETAESLGIPEETVKTRLHRARRQLRGHLELALHAEVREVFPFGFTRCDRLVDAVMRRIDRLTSGESAEPTRSL